MCTTFVINDPLRGNRRITVSGTATEMEVSVGSSHSITTEQLHCVHCED